MGKEFYYLDNKKQKGPFSVAELKTKDLGPNTLVWTEGFKEWRAAKDVEELNGLMKSPPPPPPPTFINDSNNTEIYRSQKNKILAEERNIKVTSTIKICGTIILLVFLAISLSYIIVNTKKQRLKRDLYAKIDNILIGKKIAIDGKYNGATPANGFTITKLTKINKGEYNVEIIQSSHLRYTQPSKQYIEPVYIVDGMGGKFKISDGHYEEDSRLPVNECYRRAFEYFIKGNKETQGAYTPGIFDDLVNFHFPDNNRNEYFDLAGPSGPGYYTEESSHFKSSDHSANVNSTDCEVYYTILGRYYAVSERQSKIKEDFFTYLGITIGSIILLLLILLFSKPNFFRNLSLFGKRWKSTSSQEQLFFFEHSFFGKHTFTEILNDKVSKGVLKFTDKGNVINLLYPNKEHFYKIEKISQDNLSLISISDKSKIVFKRLGAK